MNEKNQKVIGVLTSGGDAPGMNAAVRAVVRTAIKKNRQVMGIRRGYNGLINGDISEMNIRSVSNVLHRGGTMLLTARCNEFKTEEGQMQAVGVCKELGIDGLVIIGGDQIDVVVSNNDGMGMSMFNAWAKDNKVPTFGYDANSDAVAAISEGYGGTISQHADVQAYLTLRVLRNALDGVDIDTGIGTADDAGNCLVEGEDYRYSEEDRSYYALNIAVTAENYSDFTDSTRVYDKVANQLDESKSPSKKVWLNIYNASDNFLSSTYQPLLEKYDDLLNLKVDYIGGDGQTESNITNRLGNPSEYDAFAINMVKTDNAAAYTSLLSK